MIRKNKNQFRNFFQFINKFNQSKFTFMDLKLIGGKALQCKLPCENTQECFNPYCAEYQFTLSFDVIKGMGPQKYTQSVNIKKEKRGIYGYLHPLV